MTESSMPKHDTTVVLQDLYDSEVNFTITTMWDGGFHLELGDYMNGFKAKRTVKKFADAGDWFVSAGCSHFPHTEFAAKYR